MQCALRRLESLRRADANDLRGRTILARDFSIAGMAELLGRCLMRGAHSCVSFCEIFVMTERWFVSHRQEWIAETVRVFGFINREHLERKFGISTPQASKDLALYIRERPGAIAYNKSTKRYEEAT